MTNAASNRSEKVERRAARKARKREQARREIIDAATEVLIERGIGNFTLDAVARTLGVTKPAIYYYFKSKNALLHAIVAAHQKAESDTLCESIATAPSGAEALGTAIRAFARHHGANLGIFRLMYMYPQLVKPEQLGVNAESLKELVHPYTTRLYDALEEKLLEDQQRGRLAEHVHPRRLAVDAHAAVLGVMTLLSLTQVAGDPMKHTDAELIDELAKTFVASARKD